MTGRAKADPLAGRSPEMQLYRAIRRYVESIDGSIAVIGGIEVQSWPDEPRLAYRVAVKCVGRVPQHPADVAPTTVGGNPE